MAWAGVIRSPITAIGTAGGQVTAAEAIMRPAQRPVLTRSRAASRASRGLMQASPASDMGSGARGGRGEKPAKAAKGKKQSASKGKSAAVASKKKVALPEVPSPEPTGKIKWGDAGQRLWAVRRGHF